MPVTLLVCLAILSGLVLIITARCSPWRAELRAVFSSSTPRPKV
jgi:hypothetical protein